MIQKILLISSGILALLTIVSFMSGSAHAASHTVITVNSTLDTDVCQGNTCTLRGAIDKANATADLDTIEFGIPTFPVGGGHCSVIDSTCLIAPASPLPDITQPVIIDGYSQPGTSANQMGIDDNAVLYIVLKGDNAGLQTDGLTVAGGNSTIRGLDIRGFGNGIVVESDNNVIAGNFIGTDVTGTNAAGNHYAGVFVSHSHNTIGGTDVAARNLIAASGDVQLQVSGATDLRVQSNFIGVGVNHKTFSPADGIGINESENSTTIASMHVLVKQNWIQGNLIGIRVGNVPGDTSSAITLSENTILGNEGLGIDIGADGVTPNDKKDTDTGANGLQNFPVITSAIVSHHTTTIKGKLNSKPNTAYHIEIFDSTDCDLSGYGEAKSNLGAVEVKTDAQGNATFTLTAHLNIGKGVPVTATATQRIKGKLGSTSELSKCKLSRS